MIRSVLNRLRNPTDSSGVHYIVPGVNWVLDEVGRSVTSEVVRQFGLPARVATSIQGLRGQILHFGSLWETSAYLSRVRDDRNHVVGTVFHGMKDNPVFQTALENTLTNQGRFEKLHTACHIMERRLLFWGVPREQLICIPIGVDLKHFVGVTPEARSMKRAEFGIPEDAFCIGSFHKDGQGMGAGNEPKLIKGPDIFLEVITGLQKRRKIFVLLSGPARGYMRSGLEKLNVPYAHNYFGDPLQVATLYPALDAYLLTSREEGGPKGVLESLACGIPFVGTRVGLVPDVVTNEVHGLLADSEDVANLIAQVERLMSDSELCSRLTQNGLRRIREYDWPRIAARYYHEIYEPILEATNK